MITTNILRVVQLVAYFLITIQLTYYLYLMSDALKLVSLDNFYEQRNAVHSLIAKRHQIVYYAALIISLIVVVLSARNPKSVEFICSLTAFLCLITDVAVALKGNGPINEASKEYFSGAAGNWEAMRLQWLQFINIRAVFSTVGFAALIASWIIGRK